MRYITKAKRLLKEGSWAAGSGNFDITAVKKLYRKLGEERL